MNESNSVKIGSVVLSRNVSHIGANPSITVWGSTDMVRFKRPRGSWEGMFHSALAIGLGSAVSSRSSVRAKHRQPDDIERFTGLKPNSITLVGSELVRSWLELFRSWFEAGSNQIA